MRFPRLIKTRKEKNEEETGNFLYLGGGLQLNDQKMKNRSRYEWLEGAYMDISDEELSRTNKNYLGLCVSNKKLVWFLIFLFLILGLLFAQAAYLQVVKGDYYYGLAEQNRIRIINNKSPRGIIYDRVGRSLVKNVPSFAVFVTMYDLENEKGNKDEVISWLRENLLQLDIEKSLDKVLNTKRTSKEYYEPVLLVEGIEYQKAVDMRIQSVDYPGVDIEVAPRREYLTYHRFDPVTSLAHVLGYEGKISPEEYKKLNKDGYLLNDYIGKTGIESRYEKDLRGKYGREQTEVDSSGKAMKIIAKEEMVKGNNLYLSIDLEMQTKLESIIEKYLNKLGKSKAAAIIMDPQTGKIYSMVSLPGFNNNLFAKGVSQKEFEDLITDKNLPLFNRTVSGEYPSGSTIKPVISAAALEEGIITEHTSFSSYGGIRIGQWFFPDWKAGGHGITNVYKAISESVNTFYYTIGGGYGEFEGLGVLKIKEYFERFGLNKLTGVDLDNEKQGFLPTPEWKQERKDERWYIGDTYHLSIGQGDLLVTPLQVANFTSVFANKGKLYTPQLLDQVYNQEEEIFHSVEPEILNENFISDKNIEIVRQGMRQASKTGSARILNSLPVTSGAKTGTAQWGTDKTPHAWFTAFAPFENSELVITVLIEEGGEGSAVAAPITFEFMHWYFHYYKKDLADIKPVE